MYYFDVQIFAMFMYVWFNFVLEVLPWDFGVVFLIRISLANWLTCQGVAAISVIMTLVLGS